MSQIDSRFQIHDVSEDCFMMENRYRTLDGLYCWRGRVLSQPNCISASICSPVSYTDSRDKFCRYFSGSKDPRMPGDTTCVPDLYVAPLPGEFPLVANLKGGTVLHPEACEGLAGHLRCLGSGISQSIRNTPPSVLLPRVALALGALLVIALILRYTRIGKSLKKFKVLDTKGLKPKREK